MVVGLVALAADLDSRAVLALLLIILSVVCWILSSVVSSWL